MLLLAGEKKNDDDDDPFCEVAENTRKNASKSQVILDEPEKSKRTVNAMRMALLKNLEIDPMKAHVIPGLRELSQAEQQKHVIEDVVNGDDFSEEFN